MVCDYCKATFEARPQGKPPRFCPGGNCRANFYKEARRVGAQILRKDSAKKAGAARDRAGLVDRMEKEAIAAGTPGQFARPGSKPALDLRLQLGMAAHRLGLLVATGKRLENTSRDLNQAIAPASESEEAAGA